MSVEKSPDLQRALNEACETKYREFLYGGGYAVAHSKDTIAETMEEMQRQRREIEAKNDELSREAESTRQKLRYQFHPQMRDITANLKKKHGSSGLICPVCGEGDQGNRMNNKPWCMKCNVPLMTSKKAKEWKPLNKPKPENYTFNEPEGVMRWRK